MRHKQPRFLLIGAQKAGTTWLWNRVLEPHPGTSLGTKEIHYFGGVENFRKGREWYYAHFASLDDSKVIGEASTTYFFDRIPYWHNPSREIEYDESLPPIPRLIAQELPDVRILLILRNPIKRAISAYKHVLQRKTKQWSRELSPALGLRKSALRHPKYRILEYGFYARYLEAWLDVIPRDRMRIYVFEEDVVRAPERMASDVYGFLGLEPSFRPTGLHEREHSSTGMTRLWIRYYSDPLTWRLVSSRYGSVLDRFDPLGRFSVGPEDIEFLRRHYEPERPRLEELLERDLSCWSA